MIAVATAAGSIALAAVSAGVGAGTIAGATAAVVAAGALAAAVIGVQDAEDLHQQAINLLGIATTFEARAVALLDQATQRVRAQHAAGLQP